MVYERNLLDFIPNKAKLCIIKLIIMRMKILLGLMLCFLGIQIYRKTVESKKLLKKTKNQKVINYYEKKTTGAQNQT